MYKEDKEKWAMPEWMEKYIGDYLIHDKKNVERHMNAGEEINVVTNAPYAMEVVSTKAIISVLTTMHSKGLIK